MYGIIKSIKGMWRLKLMKGEKAMIWGVDVRVYWTVPVFSVCLWDITFWRLPKILDASRTEARWRSEAIMWVSFERLTLLLTDGEGRRGSILGI